MVKLAIESPISIRGKSANAIGELDWGVNRVAKAHLSKDEGASFAAWLGRYRNAVRHVSPDERCLTAMCIVICGA